MYTIAAAISRQRDADVRLHALVHHRRRQGPRFFAHCQRTMMPMKIAIVAA